MFLVGQYLLDKMKLTIVLIARDGLNIFILDAVRRKFFYKKRVQVELFQKTDKALTYKKPSYE